MDDKPYCPILSIGKVLPVPCLGVRCAWSYGYNESCALYLVAAALRNFSTAGLEIFTHDAKDRPYK